MFEFILKVDKISCHSEQAIVIKELWITPLSCKYKAGNRQKDAEDHLYNLDQQMDEHFPRQMAYEETCVGKTIGFILGDRD
jgi:hypothetical protein